MADEITATSASLTLRFKHGYTTTLIYTEALTPIPTIVSQLLSTLRERYPLGLPDPSSKPIPPTPGSDARLGFAKRVKIPQETAEVKLAVMVDPYDSTRGWQEIDFSGGALKESPKGLGIKDGAAIAYRFADIEDDNEDMEEDEKGEKFEVVWPSYEDTYPEEMEVEGEEDEGEDEDEDEDLQAIGDRKRKRGDTGA